MNLSLNRLIKRGRDWALLLLTSLLFLLAYVPKLGAQPDFEDIYNHKCAVCHGKDGLGHTMKGKQVHVKDVHANMKDSEEEMIKVATNGKGENMDSYKGELTPAQIKGVVEYYRSLGAK